MHMARKLQSAQPGQDGAKKEYRMLNFEFRIKNFAWHLFYQRELTFFLKVW